MLSLFDGILHYILFNLCFSSGERRFVVAFKLLVHFYQLFAQTILKIYFGKMFLNKSTCNIRKIKI